MLSSNLLFYSISVILWCVKFYYVVFLVVGLSFIFLCCYNALYLFVQYFVFHVLVSYLCCSVLFYSILVS